MGRHLTSLLGCRDVCCMNRLHPGYFVVDVELNQLVMCFWMCFVNLTIYSVFFHVVWVSN